MIKKRLLSAALLLSITVSVFPFPWSSIKFSGSLSTDYYLGQVREIVYPGQNWTNDYMSELLWNIDNIVMLKGSGAARLGPFAFYLSASTAVNKGTGEMDDYDWGDSTITHWTNWSGSDIFLDSSAVIDTSLVYTGPISVNFRIPLGIGYRLNYLNWSDKAGKYIYYWDFENNNYYTNVQAGDFGDTPGINYTFVQNIFFIKAGAEYKSGNFSGTVNFSYSPFVYAWDLDHHIMRGIFFLDKFTSRMWYGIEAGLKIDLDSSSAVTFSIKYEELPETVGDTYLYNEDPDDSEKVGSYSGIVKSGAGLASRIGSFSLGYARRF